MCGYFSFYDLFVCGFDKVIICGYDFIEGGFKVVRECYDVIMYWNGYGVEVFICVNDF